MATKAKTIKEIIEEKFEEYSKSGFKSVSDAVKIEAIIEYLENNEVN